MFPISVQKHWVLVWRSSSIGKLQEHWRALNQGGVKSKERRKKNAFIVSLTADKTHKGPHMCGHIHNKRSKLVGDVTDKCCTMVHERLDRRHCFIRCLSTSPSEHVRSLARRLSCFAAAVFREPVSARGIWLEPLLLLLVDVPSPQRSTLQDR